MHFAKQEKAIHSIIMRNCSTGWLIKTSKRTDYNR